MEKKKYFTPEIEVIEFGTQVDVLATSAPEDTVEFDQNWFDMFDN